jgi:hypothetical protein
MPETLRVTQDLWKYASTFLPDELDDLALRTGAIIRPRKVQDANQLLRTLLLYGHSGSFRIAAALARSSGLVDVTAEGLFYRLKCSETFLESVLVHLVKKCSSAPVGFRLLIMDATTVSGPGSTGTDWRVHVGYDPVRGVPCSVSLTDAHVGESLKLHPMEEGQLVLGDRAYGTARNVHAALQAKADVLVRVQPRQMRLVAAQTGEIMDWAKAAEKIPSTGAVGFDMELPVPPEGSRCGGWKSDTAIAWHKVRLIGARNKEADVVWLLTNLAPERLGAAQACELYRVRWQVELYFKRLKSLGDLDVITSRDGPTAKAALLAKLILLVLTNLLCHEEQAFSPYGYQVREKPVERVQMRSQENRVRTASFQATPTTALVTA